MMNPLLGALVVGACMAASAPVAAAGAEAAATASTSDSYRPLVLDRSARPVRTISGNATNSTRM